MHNAVRRPTLHRLPFDHLHSMDAVLTIDVTYDLICPWCWIGKHHLAQARAQWARTEPQIQVQVRWHGMQLLPQLPQDGVPFEAFYLHRLGSAQAVQARQAQVLEAANGAGLDIDFPSIHVMPHTARAHHLLAQVLKDSPPQHEALVEHLFHAHFSEGRNIGDPDTLVSLAQECGVDEQRAKQWVENNSPIAHTDTGIQAGVPYFVFDQRWTLSGAHPPQVLLQAMHQAQIASCEKVQG